MIQKNILLIAFVLLALAGCNNSKTGAESQRELQTKQEKIFSDFLLESAKSDLKDPDSAQVRNVVYYGSYMLAKDGQHFILPWHTICGEINARNSYGGYVGYRLFFATLIWDENKNELRDGTLFKTIDPNESESLHAMFVKNYSTYCKEREVKE